MPNIIDTLEQNAMWYCQDGMPIAMGEMEISHMRNVHAFLLRRVETLYRHKIWRDNQRGMDLDTMNRTITQDPESWLVATPFFQELESRIMRAGSIEPDSLQITS